MARIYITEEEYDRLSDHQQSKYWYCNRCGMYTLRSWSDRCECEEEK